MWATKEYRTLCTAQDAVLQRITNKETSEKDLASLVRSLCMVVSTKLELRQASRENRRVLAFPVKESLLIESTPRETTPERGQS